MIENRTAIKYLSGAAQKFASDLAKKKKKQIENGTYAISVFFETLQGQDDSDGSMFDFTEAVIRGMAKQRSGWVVKNVKRFDYEGKEFKDKDHVVLFGKNVKAETKKGWTDPKLISEGSNMDIKSIIKSIVEKKLEKDSDDPCWDGYVQLGMKKKDGKEVPNCVPKESVELDESKNELLARYMNKDGNNVLYFEIWEKPNGNLYSKISNQRGLNIAASAIDLRSSHADAKRNVERAVMFYDQDGDSGALRHLNHLLPGWKKVPIQESVELDETKTGAYFAGKVGRITWGVGRTEKKAKSNALYMINQVYKAKGTPEKIKEATSILRIKPISKIEFNSFKMNESVELDESQNVLIAKYVNKFGGNTYYFEIWKKLPSGDLYHTLSNQHGINISASNIALKGSHDDARKEVQKVVRHYDQSGDKGAIKQLNSLLPGWKKAPLRESEELFEKVEVGHDRYLRSHGKKARGSGEWMFTSKDMGDPKEDEVVSVQGKLRDAAKEAAKKLGVKRVYVMEEVQLDEGIVKSHSPKARQPWSKTVKDSANTAGEYKQIAKGKDFTVWYNYGGSLKRLAHYVVRDDKLIGSGWTMNSALKDAGLKDTDLTHRSKFSAGSILNKGMKESVELSETKTDVYHKHMLKALGKTRLPKNHSYTSMIADNGDFIVRDGAGRVAGRIPKAEHDLKESLPPHLQKHFDGKGKKIDGKWVTKNGKKTWVADKKKGNFTITDVTPKGYGPNESTELTEDVHNNLNDAIIEFQKKLMRMTRQLDPTIAKEIKKIDKDLDALRTGPLFKIRPGR